MKVLRCWWCKTRWWFTPWCWSSSSSSPVDSSTRPGLHPTWWDKISKGYSPELTHLRCIFTFCLKLTEDRWQVQAGQVRFRLRDSLWKKDIYERDLWLTQTFTFHFFFYKKDKAVMCVSDLCIEFAHCREEGYIGKSLGLREISWLSGMYKPIYPSSQQCT